MRRFLTKKFFNGASLRAHLAVAEDGLQSRLCRRLGGSIARAPEITSFQT